MKKNFFNGLRAALLCMAAAAGMQAYAEDALLTALHGTAGHSGESYDMLIDGSRSTKWCMGGFNGAYIVFKADHAFVPTSYTLITGLDTKDFPDRNWKTWSVYAANFSSDEEATRESEAWTLIDERKQLTQAEFPAGNNQPTGFECNANPTAEYKYFKIELKEIVNLNSGTMQMSEFTFSEPAPALPLTAVSGRDGLWGDGAYANLVDNSQQTKWGGDNTPIWVIVKAEEAVKPDFYRVLTARDTDANPDRNWVDWTISGANFDSDEEATVESDKWTVLDDRTGVGRDRMPAAKYTEAIFGFNQSVSEPYQYYLINITATGGKNKMQMAEFGLGFNQYELNSVRNSYYQRVVKFDYNVVAQKSLTEAYPAALQAILDGADVESVIAAYGKCADLRDAINASRTAYETYTGAVNRMRQEYSEGHFNATGMTLADSYLNGNTAPDATFANGSYAYIMANLLLDVEELNAEIAYINNFIVEYAQVQEDPIYATYYAIDGTAGSNGNESTGALFDGTESTKWCTQYAQNYVVFAASEPIKPTFYKLITGNDTGNNAGRNWKTWSIYAGDFASEEEATKDAEGWVLIDQKTNIGTDQLPAANFKSAYFYLSDAPAKAYTYFKIEVNEIMGGNVMQMAEFSFGNQASFFALRDEYYETFAGIDLESPAYRGTIDEYKQKLEAIRTTSNLADLGTLSNSLTELQNTVAESQEVYANYQMKVEEAEASVSGLDGPVAEFLMHYINDEVEPGTDFTNGSFPYIITNCQLTNAQINTEIAYLDNLIISAVNGAYLALEGTAGFVDKEGFAALVDGDTSTKWGLGNLTVANCVFKVGDMEAPYFYTLVTGNDTKESSGRNWKAWNIYGANFESDAEAKVDAEGWTLVDHRENIGQDRLPAENIVPAYFGFTEEGVAQYKYYKVEITEAYSGNQIQMGELTFGSEEDFGSIRGEYTGKAQDFNTDITAEQALLDAYTEALPNLDMAETAEQFMQAYTDLKVMQDTIALSAAAYEDYSAFIAQMQEFINDNSAMEMDILKDYVEEYVEPNETYPNGSAQYITDTHTMSAAQLAEEKAFATSLKRDAVTNGYVAGTDITIMLENPDFSDEWNGWDGTVAYATGRAANGHYGAEALKCFDLSQTLTGLKNGVYEFVMTAGYRPSDTPNSTNLAATVYANGNENYIMSIKEGQIAPDDAIDGMNCYLTGDIADIEMKDDETEEVTGYGLHGVNSVCYAISGNRHNNHITVNVTDGTLTVGIKDPGTGANWDWTGFGNARLRYLGTEEEAAEGISRTLADMAARAQTLVDYIGMSDDQYNYYPNYCADTREALEKAIADVEGATTGSERMQLVERFSNLFGDVYEEKQAYSALLAAANAIQNKWQDQPLTDAQFNELTDDLYGKGWDAFEEGRYTAEQAREATDDLLEKYPDYLVYDAGKASNSVDVEQTEPFTYVITVNGDNPFAGFTGFYADLDAERTVLHFQYRASRNVTDGEWFFATPDLDGRKNLLYGELEQTEEWKDVYHKVKEARLDYGFGNADHWIRWDITNGTDLVFEVRNIHMITEQQAIDQGGTITGIEQVEGSTETEARHAVKGIYTLTGVRVQEPLAPGLYIIDGRKVMIRK